MTIENAAMQKRILIQGTLSTKDFFWISCGEQQESTGDPSRSGTSGDISVDGFVICVKLEDILKKATKMYVRRRES